MSGLVGPLFHIESLAELNLGVSVTLTATRKSDSQ